MAHALVGPAFEPGGQGFWKGQLAPAEPCVDAIEHQGVEVQVQSASPSRALLATFPNGDPAAYHDFTFPALFGRTPVGSGRSPAEKTPD